MAISRLANVHEALTNIYLVSLTCKCIPLNVPLKKDC